MSTVFITGTNKGIGHELARQYLADGHKVIATCRDRNRADALDALLRDHTDRLQVCEMDLSDVDSLRELATELAGQPIDIFINNAGAAVGYTTDRDRNVFGALEAEIWVSMFRSNAIGPVLLAQYLFPNILLGKDKKIIFVTSKPASITDNSSGAMYMNRTSRTALNQAIKSMSIDLKDDGITVASISPGWVKTASGGKGALITAQTSASGMREVIANLQPEQTALFADYKGEIIPW